MLLFLLFHAASEAWRVASVSQSLFRKTSERVLVTVGGELSRFVLRSCLVMCDFPFSCSLQEMQGFRSPREVGRPRHPSVGGLCKSGLYSSDLWTPGNARRASQCLWLSKRLVCICYTHPGVTSEQDFTGFIRLERSQDAQEWGVLLRLAGCWQDQPRCQVAACHGHRGALVHHSGPLSLRCGWLRKGRTRSDQSWFPSADSSFLWWKRGQRHGRGCEEKQLWTLRRADGICKLPAAA